ncbi:MAG: PilW family protein [Vogesella sp.]|uniref:PilW family protein n=1 Tax=Vogesella sp. TaxID=1904252 RepID=UPI00391CCC8E
MKTRQYGLTMVELMVSLALSLFLILVAAQFFIANKSTYRTQQAQADVQERGRFAMSWLGQQIRQAGYVANSQIASSFATLYPAVNASGSAVAMGVSQLFAGSSSTLQLRVRGADDSNIVDCQGRGMGVASAVTHVINRNGNSLACDGNEVVPGVTQLVFEYGEDVSGDRIPDRYVATAPASAVYAIRVCMVVESLENNVAPSAVGFTDCGNTASSTSNNRIAKVFRTSVYVRNAP